MVYAYLEDDVVAELRAEATRKGVSLSDQIRQVIEWGLASLEDVRSVVG